MNPIVCDYGFSPVRCEMRALFKFGPSYRSSELRVWAEKRVEEATWECSSPDGLWPGVELHVSQHSLQKFNVLPVVYGCIFTTKCGIKLIQNSTKADRNNSVVI